MRTSAMNEISNDPLATAAHEKDKRRLVAVSFPYLRQLDKALSPYPHTIAIYDDKDVSLNFDSDPDGSSAQVLEDISDSTTRTIAVSTRNKSGELLFTITSEIALDDDDDKTVSMIEDLLKVTAEAIRSELDAREAKEAASWSLDLSRCAISYIDDALIVVNDRGNVINCNARAANLMNGGGDPRRAHHCVLQIRQEPDADDQMRQLHKCERHVLEGRECAEGLHRKLAPDTW